MTTIKKSLSKLQKALDINFVGELQFFALDQDLASRIGRSFTTLSLLIRHIDFGQFSETPAARQYHRLKRHQALELSQTPELSETVIQKTREKHKKEKLSFLKAIWQRQSFDLQEHYPNELPQSVKIGVEHRNFYKGKVTLTFNLNARNFDALDNSPELQKMVTETIAREATLRLAEILAKINEGDEKPSAKDYVATNRDLASPEISFEKPKKGNVVQIHLDLSEPFKNLVNASMHGHGERFDHSLFNTKILEALNNTIQAHTG